MLTIDRNRRGAEQIEGGRKRGMAREKEGERGGCPARISTRPLEFLWCVSFFLPCYVAMKCTLHLIDC